MPGASFLFRGRALPVNHRRLRRRHPQVVPDDVPPAPSAEDADAATPSAAGPVRRAAMMLRADVRPRRQSSEVQAQKEAQKKDPVTWTMFVGRGSREVHFFFVI